MHKSTIVYRSPDDITNLKIRIKITENSCNSDDPLEEIQTFRWQQKIFGQFERNYYLDKNNCVTELEKKYHTEVSQLTDNNNILFSYVNEDNFETEDNFVTMQLMADLGDYQAVNLCTIKYDSSQKFFTILPDFTQFEPYYIHIEGDTKKIYQYRIDDVSEKIPIDELLKENEILDKIHVHQLKLKFKNANMNFEIPLKNKLNICLFLEILSARNFEYNNIYVQYFIDLPQHWNCINPSALKGCTHISHSSTFDKLSYFGLPFEILLEYDLQRIDEGEILKTPYIYFEIVSRDSWDRFRTEGLAYSILPITQAGVYNYELRCLRICPKGITGNLRRFFIGDFSNYDNITWTSIPKDYEKSCINKYGVHTIGTGQINVRMSVIQQSQAFITNLEDDSIGKRQKFILDKLNTSILIKSIEQVVVAFNVAKRKMIDARKNV